MEPICNSVSQQDGVTDKSSRLALATLRFIDSGPCTPFYNMAVDEAMLRMAGDSLALRLYAWNPPALSLGYFQSARDFDLEDLHVRGIPVLRRPTGGGAIYHYRELTFAVTAGRTALKLLGTTIEERYERIHGVIIKALSRFAISSRMRGKEYETPFSAPGHSLCFNRTIGCDIVAGGRKLVGSAQKKTPKGFLQHGSIPLWENPMTPGAAWANEFSECEVTYSLLGAAVKEEFESSFNLKLAAGSLTNAEEAAAQTLVKEKYSTDSWNKRR